MLVHLFCYLFCLFASQEELRELRQQPIDPQAEQEIIDGIEEVYYSDDSIDMVQYELEVTFSFTPRSLSFLYFSIFIM